MERSGIDTLPVLPQPDKTIGGSSLTPDLQAANFACSSRIALPASHCIRRGGVIFFVDFVQHPGAVGLRLVSDMASRLPAAAMRPLRTGSITRPSPRQVRWLATPVHPVTQDATSSRGPTAMVFLNMGGPSTTDEVGDFLSRLFVRVAHLPHGWSCC